MTDLDILEVEDDCLTKKLADKLINTTDAIRRTIDGSKNEFHSSKFKTIINRYTQAENNPNTINLQNPSDLIEKIDTKYRTGCIVFQWPKLS